jgi:hypothetical protein
MILSADCQIRAKSILVGIQLGMTAGVSQIATLQVRSNHVQKELKSSEGPAW